MKLFIGDRSALEYWAAHSPESCRSTNIVTLQDCAWRAKDVAQFNLSEFNLEANKLDVMVGQRDQRGRCSWITHHVHQGTLYPGAYCEAKTGLLIASPELVFEQLRKQRTMMQSLLSRKPFTAN